MYEIRYLPLAKDDLHEIVSYITDKLKSPKAALQFLDDLDAAVSSLEEFPYSHSVFRTIKPLKEEYRMLPVKNYAVFYVVREPEHTVEIFRVMYSKRDLIKQISNPER